VCAAKARDHARARFKAQVLLLRTRARAKETDEQAARQLMFLKVVFGFGVGNDTRRRAPGGVWSSEQQRSAPVRYHDCGDEESRRSRVCPNALLAFCWSLPSAFPQG
jgi:hypothetical protein